MASAFFMSPHVNARCSRIDNAICLDQPFSFASLSVSPRISLDVVLVVAVPVVFVFVLISLSLTPWFASTAFNFLLTSWSNSIMVRSVVVSRTAPELKELLFFDKNHKAWVLA